MDELPDPRPNFWRDHCAWCEHVYMDEPDELGDQLCVKCETTVRTTLTEDGMLEFFKHLRDR